MEITKKRGRPPKDKPMTARERKQRHREKLAAQGKVTITIELPSIVVEIIDTHRRVLSELSGEPMLSRSEQIESSLESWAIDAADSIHELLKLAKEREVGTHHQTT